MISRRGIIKRNREHGVQTRPATCTATNDQGKKGGAEKSAMPLGHEKGLGSTAFASLVRKEKFKRGREPEEGDAIRKQRGQAYATWKGKSRQLRR